MDTPIFDALLEERPTVIPFAKVALWIANDLWLDEIKNRHPLPPPVGHARRRVAARPPRRDQHPEGHHRPVSIQPRWKHNALLHRWEYLLGGEVQGWLEDVLWEIPAARASFEDAMRQRFAGLTLPDATLTL